MIVGCDAGWGGRCHMISDILCSSGDGTTSVRGLPTSRLL